MQIRSTDLYGAGTYSSMMVRHADSGTGVTTSLFWDNRFGLGDSWRIYPRVRVDRRTFSRMGDEQLTARPSLRLDYRHGRRLRFEFETGYEWSERDMANGTLDLNGFFVRAGYRGSF
jgi:hypothetical protein